jgi:Uma2 family endonuclease
MRRMSDMQELIEKPLSPDELATRYRAMCDDPCFANVPGKVELDVWGRVLMTPPPSAYHGLTQSRLDHKLRTALGGEVITEAPIVTPAGLFLADLAWLNAAYVATHGIQTPLAPAPEICIEVVSPSNSVKELSEKRDAYLAAGAQEVWLIYPKSKRCEFYGKQELLPGSRYNVDLSDLFN